MSHNLSGIFFENQVIASKGMRTLAHSLLSDGVITGCEISYSGASVTIAAGYLLVAGGLMQNPAAQTLSLSGASSGYARIKAVADLSKTATKTEFLQAFFEVEYSSTADGFASLVQENINAGGTVYEVAICVAALSSSGVTSVIVAPPSAEYNHENLLSNWYFADPVNSQQQTEYTNGKTIDGWELSAAGSVVVNNDGSITLSASESVAVAFTNRLGYAMEAGVYTLSAQVASFSGYVALRAQRTDTWVSVDSTITTIGLCSSSLTLDAVNYRFGLLLGAGASITLKSIKLEKGSASTLAGDPPPSKNIEAVKCNGAVSMTKLWENASPSSDFAAQTISLDLSGYEKFILQTVNGTMYRDGLVIVNKEYFRMYSSDAYFTQRFFEFTDTGLVVYSGNYYSGGWKTGNGALKPLVIYGIKGVT